MINKLVFGSFSIQGNELLGNVKYSININKEDNICIGTAASASLTFKTTKTGLNVGDTFSSHYKYDESLAFTREGTFNIYSITKDIDVYTVTAYDNVSLLETPIEDFIQNETFPITLGNLFNDLCAYYSLTPYSLSFINSAYVVNCDKSNFNNKTGRELLGWIAEVSAGFALARVDGKIQIGHYSDNQTAIDIPTSSRYSSEVKEYNAARINKLKISYLKVDEGTTWGSGDNQYDIVGNPLLFTVTTEGQQIYNEISAYNYYPMKAETLPSLNISVGRKVTIDGKTSYIMSKERENHFTYSSTGPEIWSQNISDYEAMTTGLANGSTQISGECIKMKTLTADKIEGGTLTLGGNNNQYGTLMIKDENNNQVGLWNNNGINISKGIISIDSQLIGPHLKKYYPLSKDSAAIINYQLTVTLAYYMFNPSESYLQNLRDLVNDQNLTHDDVLTYWDFDHDGVLTSSDVFICQSSLSKIEASGIYNSITHIKFYNRVSIDANNDGKFKICSYIELLTNGVISSTIVDKESSLSAHELKLEDKPIHKYIVSYGYYQDGWEFNEWSDGIVEIWNSFTFQPTAWVAWGNIYETNTYLDRQNWPITFAEVPFVTANCYGAGGSMLESYYLPTTTQSPAYWAVRGATGYPFPITVNIYAKGRKA